MANTVGSITDWMPIVCSDHAILGFCSSRQAYLYILYSLKPPFELPTYNNRSGVIRECGVELHFEHVNCIPQNEPLASTCRSFTLPSHPDGTGPWPGQFNFGILGSSPFRTGHETIGPSLPAGAPWEASIIGNFLLNGP